MKRLSLALLTVLAVGVAIPGFAAAHPKNTTTYVPPGLSSASQYVEVVPTAGGGKASISVHAGGGGSGGSGPSSGAGASSSVPSKTLKQLSKDGSTGADAANFAAATAPGKSKSTSRPAKSVTVPAPKSGASGSPTGEVLKAAVSPGGSGGLGIALPVILIASVVLASGLGIVRMRRPTS
jgi:hypothetical protein